MESSNDVIVFGSNEAGYHGAGAAKYAMDNHGAIWGRGVGLYGNSYALPTKDKKIQTLPIQDVEKHIKDFLEVAKRNPDKTFWVTQVGCGLAGFTKEDIAPYFVDAMKIDNIKLPEAFLNIIAPGSYNESKISFTI